MFSNPFNMTLIEKLPVDNYKPSEIETQVLNILFPNPPSQSLLVQECKHEEETCPTISPTITLIKDILLLIFCILFFSLPQFDNLIKFENPNYKIAVKLLIVIVLLICVKKFMLY